MPGGTSCGSREECEAVCCIVEATAPATVAPTTVAPTTVAPTTVAPTTVAPTTFTEAPTTEAWPTPAPTPEPTTATVAPRTPPSPCEPWNMCASMNPQVVAVFNPTVDPAYTLTKFEIEEAGGADRAFLYSNAGICWLAFQDTDTTFANFASDWGNNMNWAPVEKWGFTGLHAGLVNELEGLIGLMDFASMRDECSVSFSVAGYSLGGSLAQMFAVLINAAHDPLDADLRVDELYSFGAFAPMASEARNDKAADGCFAGAQYSVAFSTSTGGYAADVVYSTDVGGHVHSFGHSNKVFILPDGSQRVFPCDTPLPEGQDLFKDLLQGDWTPYLQAHASYPFLLGCVATVTEAPTTVAPTTVTEAPTTGAWPTPAPTTATVAPSTVAPTTATEAPTTGGWPTPL